MKKINKMIRTMSWFGGRVATVPPLKSSCGVFGVGWGARAGAYWWA